jgi:putative endonuclease
MNRKGADADENWGQVAEQLASEYLMAKGYTIRERNWRPKGSHLEVDIITQADNVIVFVEVKARTDEDYDPADAVGRKKISRLVRAANAYLQSLPYGFEYRFDVITVSGTQGSCTLDHLEDAFLPPLTTR